MLVVVAPKLITSGSIRVDVSSASRLARTLRADIEMIRRSLAELDVELFADCEPQSFAPQHCRPASVVLPFSGDEWVSHLVATHRISADWLAFLFGGYIHLDTPCAVRLAAQNGEWHQLRATIVVCRYVHGPLHLCIARFHAPIDQSVYCGGA